MEPSNSAPVDTHVDTHGITLKQKCVGRHFKNNILGLDVTVCMLDYMSWMQPEE